MQISDAELDVMKVVWDRPGSSAADVHEALTAQRDWTLQTVKTLLARLVEKNALDTRREGRRFLYVPRLERAEYEAKAARNFIDKVYSGRAAPLVAHLAEAEGLSEEDLAELEALIERLKS